LWIFGASFVWTYPIMAAIGENDHRINRWPYGISSLLNGQVDENVGGVYRIIVGPMGVGLCVSDRSIFNSQEDSIVLIGHATFGHTLLRHFDPNHVPIDSRSVKNVSNNRVSIFKFPKRYFQRVISEDFKVGEFLQVLHRFLQWFGDIFHENSQHFSDFAIGQVGLFNNFSNVVSSDRIATVARHGPIDRANFENFAELFVGVPDLAIRNDNYFGGISQDHDSGAISGSPSQTQKYNYRKKPLHVRLTMAQEGGITFSSDGKATTFDVSSEDVDVSKDELHWFHFSGPSCYKQLPRWNPHSQRTLQHN
jgi:hypothetical protein